jgi:hypothetical protein
MKAIIIEEVRFVEIIETLKFQSEKLISETDNSDVHEGIRQAHRNFHYYLVRWMQSHGASAIR